MAYVKLDGGILESTVWSEPYHVRIVWIGLLAMKDRNHEIEASIPGIAKRCGVSIDEAIDAIDRLSRPDPHSRTPDCEGRRLVKIDGGWAVVNGEKYRQKGSREEKLQRDAARAKSRRVAHRRVASPIVADRRVNLDIPDTDPDPDPEADPEAEAEAGSITGDSIAVAPSRSRRPRWCSCDWTEARYGCARFRSTWQRYPSANVGSKKIAFQRWGEQANEEGGCEALEAAVGSALDWQVPRWESLDERGHDASGEFCAPPPHVSTYLHQRRWEAERPTPGPRRRSASAYKSQAEKVSESVERLAAMAMGPEGNEPI